MTIHRDADGVVLRFPVRPCPTPVDGALVDDAVAVDGAVLAELTPLRVRPVSTIADEDLLAGEL